MDDNYVKLAKKAVKKAVTGKDPGVISQLKEKLPTHRKGVFVTLKKLEGELRGCIGTHCPVTDSVGQEIIRNAKAAALQDPRFPPVQTRELEEITASVDVLSVPEVCEPEELDPDNFGIIVKKGENSGLLLPDLEGVDTAEKQLEIAKKKAGLSPSEQDFTIKRFKVDRHEGESPIRD